MQNINQFLKLFHRSTTPYCTALLAEHVRVWVPGLFGRWSYFTNSLSDHLRDPTMSS